MSQRKTGVTIMIAGQVLVTQEPIQSDMQFISDVRQRGKEFRGEKEEWNGMEDEWHDIATVPESGSYEVMGGYYNTAYGQLDGFSHDGITKVEFVRQTNLEVDPPFRVVGEIGLGIDNPTHWRPCR